MAPTTSTPSNAGGAAHLRPVLENPDHKLIGACEEGIRFWLEPTALARPSSSVSAGA
jgi:hypothetical protein